LPSLVVSLAWRIEPADLGDAIRASRWRAGGAQEHPLGPAPRHVAIGLRRLLMGLSIAVAVRRSLALATMVPRGWRSGASENFAAGNRG
jgi:hypothetical protein